MNNEFKLGYGFHCTEVGKLNFGIDGWDTYYNVHDHNDPADNLNHNDLHNLAKEEFWHETQQEAGGYFCKSVSVYMNTLYDKDDSENQPFEYILVVHHRYDV